MFQWLDLTFRLWLRPRSINTHLHTGSLQSLREENSSSRPQGHPLLSPQNRCNLSTWGNAGDMMASWGNRAEWRGRRKGTSTLVDLCEPASQRFLRKTVTHKAQRGNGLVFRFRPTDFCPTYSFCSGLTPTNNVNVLGRSLISFHIRLYENVNV